MSSIAFHTREGVARVSGRERALMGDYCGRALLFALGHLSGRGAELPWIMKHIPAGCYLHGQDTMTSRARVEDIRTWLSVGFVGETAGLLLEGKMHSLFGLQLNSALAMGGDALKLAARLHGQCENHCYVKGRNRAWLARLIDEAVADGIFRADAWGYDGWQAVSDLLRESTDGSVVCSYSVCDSFPNSRVAGWEPTDPEDEDGEGWYDLPENERWDMAVSALMRNEVGLELRPELWSEFRFDDGKSGFDFSNRDAKP